jgi:hypothetical protein
MSTASAPTWTQPELALEWPPGTTPPIPPTPGELRLAELRRANQAAYAALTTPDPSGTRAIPDPVGVLNLRLQLLLDMLLPSASFARTEYEITFEEQMAETLAACQAERRKLLLTAPGGVPANLIVPR